MRQNKSCWLAAVVLAGLVSAVPLQGAAPPSDTLKEVLLLRVKEVHFSGNSVASDEQLRYLVPDEKWGIQGNWVTVQQFADETVATLVSYYRSFGCLDACVIHRFSYPGGGRIAIEFCIEEGPRYRVRHTPEIMWLNQPHPYFPMTQPPMRVRAGDYYNQDDIDGDISRLDSEFSLHRLGYELRPVLFWKEKDRAEVSLRYEPGPPPPPVQNNFWFSGFSR